MAPVYKLTYFNARYRAEPIRLMFAYAKVPYEDIRIEMEDWPKFKGTTPWGQIPILEVEGVQISQTKAIARFVAKRHGLAGESPLEEAKCDEYLDVLADMSQEFSQWHREPDPKKKAELLPSMEQEVFPRYLGKFEEIIKKNGNGVLVGKKWTYADIFLRNQIEILGTYFPEADLTKFPEVMRLSGNVSSLPGIKEWLERRPETSF